MTHRILMSLTLTAWIAPQFSVHAQASVPNQTAPSVQEGQGILYLPTPKPGSATLTSVQDDLAALLRERSRPVGLRFGSHTFTRVDINIYANWNELCALLGAATKVYTFRYDNINDPGSVLKRIEYKTIPVLMDRIEISPRVVFPFREILDGPIALARNLDDETYPYVIRLPEQLSFFFHKKDLG